MKITIEENDTYEADPEVIIRCKKVDANVQKILSLLDIQKKKLLGYYDNKECVIERNEVLYCESVEGTVYIYGIEKVYKTSYTLNEIEGAFTDSGYFRCSKSMIINIHEIKNLKSELGNRINATLTNGEHIIISRHYAKQLRAILREVSSL